MTIVVDATNLEVAWSMRDAERYVANYLAALSSEAYAQAAYSADTNGVEVEGQNGDETSAEAFERMCAGGLCSGPYLVDADGPGILDPRTSAASSTVTVTHVATGMQKVMLLGTFEGQIVIAQLPPLAASTAAPSLVEQLFGDEIPERVVIERFHAFEIWENASPDWVSSDFATNPFTGRIRQIEGDVIASFESVVALRDPQTRYKATCARLMTRGTEVLVLDECASDGWQMIEATTGEPRAAPIPFEEPGEAEYAWFTERSGTVAEGTLDAEGNFSRLEALDDTDLLGDDYASNATLSTDGSLLAYVDHADPAAESHFWSPVVVVKDVATGAELGRWTLDNSVLCLEFAESWLVACETDGDYQSFEYEQVALAAINVDTGVINRVETPTRIYLPT